jgi:death-on-curing protein
MNTTIRYLSVQEIRTIHDDIVAEYDDTGEGTRTAADVEFALQYVRGDHFGEEPATIHEKAFHLLRLLVANHPFVDANKRTALNATAAVYACNGYQFDYDAEIRELLKAFGTDESAVDEQAVLGYLRAHTHERGDAPEKSVSRVAWVDRDEHREIYDALEHE